MAHRFRFIGTRSGSAGTDWLLGEEETQHLAKVLKLTVGTEVEVTDGEGQWCRGQVKAIKGKETVVSSSELFQDPPPVTFVTVAIGALKPGSIDDVLPALVELGADQIVVFQNAGTAKFRLQDSVWARWQRIVRQSIKQCKRSRIPEIKVCDSVDGVIESYRLDRGLGLVLDAEGERPLHQVLTTDSSDRITLVIGSEKGLEPEELSALVTAGFIKTKLGSNILRAVTAIPAALGVVASIKK